LLNLHNDEVVQVLHEIKGKLDYFVLGKGCNVLIADSGFDGVVIRLIDDKIVVHDNTICVDSGASLNAVLNIASTNGLSGLEWAAGLPSSFGGAIVGNAGARGFCIGDVLNSCQVVYKNDIIDMEKGDCGFGYRTSVFKQCGYIVLNCTLNLTTSCIDTVKANIKHINSLRNNPKGRSAGSIFKNTTDYTAGQLIDSVGLKGTTIGGARISNQHANFIINYGNATSNDIYQLIVLAQNKVREKYGILLDLEIVLIGF